MPPELFKTTDAPATKRAEKESKIDQLETQRSFILNQLALIHIKKKNMTSWAKTLTEERKRLPASSDIESFPAQRSLSINRHLITIERESKRDRQKKELPLQDQLIHINRQLNALYGFSKYESYETYLSAAPSS